MVRGGWCLGFQESKRRSSKTQCKVHEGGGKSIRGGAPWVGCKLAGFGLGGAAPNLIGWWLGQYADGPRVVRVLLRMCESLRIWVWGLLGTQRSSQHTRGNQALPRVKGAFEHGFRWG